ncbi:MAG: PilN domain-containing protein [Candidatus Tectimicrobiota bacterium]
MIRINLLPAREARRRVELRRQAQVAVGVILLTVGGGAWGYVTQNDHLAMRQQELAQVEAEIKRLEAIIKEVQKFENQKALLDKKVGAIQDIKTKQRRPARVLDDVSRSLPDQMWLVSVKDSGSGLQISGKSFDNVAIAAFMENLERSSSFGSVELIESKSELLQGRPVVAFTVVARLAAKKKEATS